MYKEGRRSADGDCLEVQGRTHVTIKFGEIYEQTTLAGAWVTVLHRVKTARPRHACECGGRVLYKATAGVSAQRPDTRSSSSAGQTVIMRHARSAATRWRRRTSFAGSSA